MNQRFQNKVVLVSGTSSGIGEKVALTFAEQGAKIILSSRNADLNEDLVRKIKKSGGKAPGWTRRSWRRGLLRKRPRRFTRWNTHARSSPPQTRPRKRPRRERGAPCFWLSRWASPLSWYGRKISISNWIRSKNTIIRSWRKRKPWLCCCVCRWGK